MLEGTSWFGALVNLIPQSRGQIRQLGRDFEELEKLVGELGVPRDVLQAVHHMARRQKGIGLSEAQLRERLSELQKLHILPENRVHPGLIDPDTT